MLRRDVLKLPAPLALGMRQAGALKLSVRVEPLFPSLSLEAQIEKVRKPQSRHFEMNP